MPPLLPQCAEASEFENHGSVQRFNTTCALFLPRPRDGLTVLFGGGPLPLPLPGGGGPFPPFAAGSDDSAEPPDSQNIDHGFEILTGVRYHSAKTEPSTNQLIVLIAATKEYYTHWNPAPLNHTGVCQRPRRPPAAGPCEGGGGPLPFEGGGGPLPFAGASGSAGASASASSPVARMPWLAGAWTMEETT